jgi:hypothetical protein
MDNPETETTLGTQETGGGTAYHSGTAEFTPDLQVGSCCSIFNFLHSAL